MYLIPIGYIRLPYPHYQISLSHFTFIILQFISLSLSLCPHLSLFNKAMKRRQLQQRHHHNAKEKLLDWTTSCGFTLCQLTSLYGLMIVGFKGMVVKVHLGIWRLGSVGRVPPCIVAWGFGAGFEFWRFAGLVWFFWVLLAWVSLADCGCCCRLVVVFLSLLCFTLWRVICVNLDLRSVF